MTSELTEEVDLLIESCVCDYHSDTIADEIISLVKADVIEIMDDLCDPGGDIPYYKLYERLTNSNKKPPSEDEG
jgi:hypothetical protein